MEIKDFRRWANRLGIKKLIILESIIRGRMHKLEIRLTEVLPEDLREKYIGPKTIPYLCANGNCALTVFQDIGSRINDSEKEKYYQQAREELAPMVKAWLPFGVRLKRISYISSNNGLIEAQFKVD